MEKQIGNPTTKPISQKRGRPIHHVNLIFITKYSLEQLWAHESSIVLEIVKEWGIVKGGEDYSTV